MTLKRLIEHINLSPEAQKIIYAFEDSVTNYNEYKKLFYSNEELFYLELEKQYKNEYYQAIMYFYCKFAVDLYDKFISGGFDEQIYFDTFADLRIWNEVCVLEKGVCGIAETGWLTSHLNMGIVKLGRLQFQKTVVEEDLIYGDTTIKAGTTAYNIHIPKGEPLSGERIKNSFDLAKKHFGNDLIFLIESWLLDPTLKKYLDENSNIIAFQNMFTTYKTEESDSMERYVFGKKEEDKNNYKPSSKFAEKVKTALLNGETFYVGFGFMKLS